MESKTICKKRKTLNTGLLDAIDDQASNAPSQNAGNCALLKGSQSVVGRTRELVFKLSSRKPPEK